MRVLRPWVEAVGLPGSAHLPPFFPLCGQNGMGDFRCHQVF